MRLLHLSDLHIGVDDNGLALLKIINHINMNYGWDVPVAITGDLVDTPSDAMYSECAGLLKKLAPRPLWIVPGNHDLCAMGVDIGFGLDAEYDQWNKWIRPLMQPTRRQQPYIWHHDNVQVIGLDTMAGTVGDWVADTARGAVGKRQLYALTQLLQHTPTIVLGHHRVHWEDLWHRLRDSADVAEILEPRALLYLCGHQHKEDRVFGNGTVYLASHRTTQGPLRYAEVSILDDEIFRVWKWL